MWLNLDAIFDPDRHEAASAGPVRQHPPDPIADDLPPDWHFEWDERAAVMEYDAGLIREQAEHLALLDILARMRGESRPPEVRGQS